MPNRNLNTHVVRKALLGSLAGGLICVLLLAACGSKHRSSTSSAAAPQTTTSASQPATPVAPPSKPRPVSNLETIMEPVLQLLQNPSGTMQTMKSLGVSIVKVTIPWYRVAPYASSNTVPNFDASDPNAYPSQQWAPYDAIVEAAAAQHVPLDVTIAGSGPAWAAGAPGAPSSGEPAGGPIGVWKVSASEFGEFVHAVAERYDGHFVPTGSSTPLPRVSFWSLWNEPNYGVDLAPQAIDGGKVEVSPALYRGLLDAGWAALQATGHGHDTILFGELAPRGQTVGDHPGNFDGMVPLRFLRALYCVDSNLKPLSGQAAAARDCPTDAAGTRAFPSQHPALFKATGLAIHPYPQNQPPTFVTPDEPDYADLAAVSKLEHMLDTITRAYGDSRQIPLYSTEYGYHTSPPETAGRAVPPQTAAYYMNWGEYLSWSDPRIRTYDQYLLQDPPGSGELFATGLLTGTGAPKPGLDAFRLPLFLPVPKVAAGQSVLVWGCVRPITYLPRPQRVQIEFARSSGGPWNVVRTIAVHDPHGYFQLHVHFPATGFVRLAWKAPDGTTYHSRVATVTIG